MTIANFDTLLAKYADVITSIGVNVQPGQDILLYADVEQQQLAHLIIDSAYQRGANQVMVEWQDTYVTKNFLAHADEASITHVPTSVTVRAQELVARSTSRISLISADPDALGAIDSQTVANYSKAQAHAKKPIMEATMNNDISWLVVAGAGQAWAEKVFPDLKGADAVDRLWREIFKITRISVDNDPVADWKKHIALLSEKAAWLNDNNFKELRYTSPRTQLTVGLAENHIWEGADSKDKAGNYFTANMPTEEVFTAPDYRNIHGTVTATKPLSYGGVLINDIQLTFEAGRVVKASASTGEDVLKHLLDSDDGARSLGEVSLVPDPSPISQSGIIFYNTLIDENASDHLALGAAYPFNLKNGTQLSDDARHAKGQNLSIIHVDFMMGSADMSVDGVRYDGTIVPVFRQGDWA
ncbi:aminopeptidase [Weissella diestrammenae]|uniref:Aminopeptidase n=1 Tax=Weissella diestrammenae TaxID=1162633 RepID=A0A7G9T7B9_9LACO|nr:aminopeptidase [Weissella diestrammenae]MCM0582005.1 aminopeptidase [Weissella diestrammenae]QNN75994.1 aminopeptidase [Weissella diestrammenae]